MIKLIRALFFINAAIWVVFAAATFLGGIPGIPDAGPAVAVMAGLMLGNAAALAVAGWGLGQRTPLFYFFALAVLVVNMVLTITDQMGVWDWLTLVFDAVILGLLLSVGKRYVGGKI